MSARKLTDSDKREILKLYRHPEETTSTLAVRYSVSNSTISRFLKSNLSEQEYEALIQQKRANRTQTSVSEPVEQMLEPEEQEIQPEPASSNPSIIRRRKRSSAASESISTVDESDEIPASPEVPEALEPTLDFPTSAQDVEPEALENNYSVEARLLEEMLGEDLTDLDDEEDEDEDEDEDEELDLDDEDGDEDDWEEDSSFPAPPIPRNIFSSYKRANVQVLPLSEASIPRICYLVVDRAAELIARPLREFSDLGQIPVEEFQQKTLPIFDNHRVARRFSNRTQRVIKVPDGRMLQKTSSQLKAKGITRLLIDGQVYSLLN